MKSVESQRPLYCDGNKCKVAVDVVRPYGQILAICDALCSGEKLGPPTHCGPFAVQVGSAWWIEVLDGGESYSPIMGLAKVYTFGIKGKGIPRSTILAALDRGLSTRPLIMTDRTVKEDRIMAVAPRRFSNILSGGWFEWAQVPVEIDSALKVDVSLDLLVNKQNSSDPVDWHLPTYQQEEQYTKAIEDTVTQSLADICIQPGESLSQPVGQENRYPKTDSPGIWPTHR